MTRRSNFLGLRVLQPQILVELELTWLRLQRLPRTDHRRPLGKRARLVVLLVLHNQDGDLSWPLPSTALSPSNRLFWGESKVIIGESVLKPRFAASWKRVQ